MALKWFFRRTISSVFILFPLLALLPHLCFSSSEYTLSKGQTVYVPVYSNVLTSPKAIPFSLATMLIIRNTDLASGVTITAADYYDTKGTLLKRYYSEPVTLAPLESTHLYLSEKDTAGGIGASFIVRWKAPQEINVPIIECVMMGTRGGQGISFVSPGKVIRESLQ